MRKRWFSGIAAAILLLLATTAFIAQAATVPIIGYYKLGSGSASNLVVPGKAMTLRNVPLSSQGGYLNGIYISAASGNGCLALTDPLLQLNPADFTVMVEFKTDKTDILMPILVVGMGYRSLTLYVSPTNQLYVNLNNNLTSYPLQGVLLQPNRWYKAAVSLNVANSTIRFAIDGGPAQTIPLPPGFTLEIMGAGVSDASRAADAVVMFTDYSNSLTFSGYLKTLIVYSGAVSADTLQQITTTLPAIPGANITLANPGPKHLSDGIFDVTATSTVNLPITVRSLTPSICTVTGMSVTPVSEGTCTLVASQSGATANATVNFSVSAFNYQPLVRTPLGKGAYLVASGLDLTKPFFNPSASNPDYNDITAVDHAKELTQYIYNTYGNAFDSIFIVSNADISTVDSVGYYGMNFGIVSNESGLGITPYNRAADYGARPRLHSLIHIPFREGIVGGPGLHEFMHNWANHGFISDTSVPGHWGYASTNGQLGGFERASLVQVGPQTWHANATGLTGFGSFANNGNSIPYSNVELYLMGLIPAEQLEPITVAKNPQQATAYGNDPSYFTAEGFDTLSGADLIARAGARFPQSDLSQKRFDVLFILLSNTTPTSKELTDFDSQIEEFTRTRSDGRFNLYNFWEATGGRAMMIPVDIATAPKATDVTTSHEAVLSWAEHVFPTMFPSAGRSRGQTGIYDYACYTTGLCLGLDAQGNVYYYNGTAIIQVGKSSDYAGHMQASGF